MQLGVGIKVLCANHALTKKNVFFVRFEQLVPLTDLAFNIMLTMFIAMATSFHYLKGGEQMKGWGPQLMLAFSLKTNMKKLVELPKDPQSCITCMFGIRFLSMVWTLIGHSFIFIQV